MPDPVTHESDPAFCTGAPKNWVSICGAEDSWESLGQQGDQTNQS